MVYENLTKKILEMDGIIEPIYIDNKDSGGTGLCNASLLYNDNILHMILRNVEYTLHSSENKQKYQTCFEGPLSYYHRDNDLKLRTTNFQSIETWLALFIIAGLVGLMIERSPFFVSHWSDDNRYSYRRSSRS